MTIPVRIVSSFPHATTPVSSSIADAVHLLSNALYEAQHTSSQTLLYCARRWCYASILVVGGALITSVSMGIQVIASGFMITAFRSRHLCYKQRIREPGNTCHLQRRTQPRILIRC